MKGADDELGESLSISNEKDLMMLIDFEGVERFIEANREISDWKRERKEGE